MPRGPARYCFLGVLCTCLFLGLCCEATPRVFRGSNPARDVAETSPRRNPIPQTSPPDTGTTEQRRTEQYKLSHDRYEKAVEYSRAGYTLYFVSYFWGLLVLILLLRLGIAAAFRNFAEKVSDRWWTEGLVFIPLLLLTLGVLHLPARMYGHALSLRYEQSVQGWGSWFGDWIKGELLGTAFGIVLGLILFAVMRRNPRRWWLLFWFPASLIVLGLILITPLVIDPLFNQFEPLRKQHPDLVASIEELTKHAGVPISADHIFLMVASKKTNAVNAYVTGLGASKRVVLWDTTIQKTTHDEVLFIVGHELGHYVLGHVLKSALLGLGGLLLALYLLFRGLHGVLSLWGRDCKISGPEDWVSLVVLLLLLQLILFFASPAINAVSRIEEHAADVYGLEVIHGLIPNSEEVAAHSFQVLGELDLQDPNPPALIKFWLYSHPPLAERLVFAHRYDPWSEGKPPRYVKEPERRVAP